MFKLELEKLYKAKIDKDGFCDSIYLCEECKAKLREELDTKHSSFITLSRVFGKPIVKEIVEKYGKNGEVLRYEKCIKCGLKLVGEEN